MKFEEIPDLFEEIKRRGLSVAKFAAQIGVPADRVYQWQRGRGKPKAEDVVKIQGWLKGSVIKPELPPDLTQRVVELEAKEKAHGALLSVLLTSMAEMISATSGENIAVVRRKLERASEDVLKLG